MSVRPVLRPGPLHAPLPAPLYAIVDAEVLGPAGVPGAVGEIAASGIGWLQLRAKSFSGRELFTVAEGCLRALAGSGARLWIDDRADVAALLPVAGVHVGQHDLPPRAVRQVVGDRFWIGLSTHTRAQLEAADADPDVDLIAVGPIFPTAGKARPDPVVGVSFLRWARRRTCKPLVAIGGIGPGNLEQVLAAGADAAAVLGAVCRGGVAAVGANCRRLLAAAAAAATHAPSGRGQDRDP
ncbi:MAG TPA: thiamine phosphate synthase [Thermoanaerobaculia bacterium]|nr:thiamine phosphate synthase [Thermoanaerobaculia bacterium]